MTLRAFIFSRWWLRPAVYTLVALLAAGSGYGIQRGQQSANNASSVSKEAALKSYTDAAASYHTYAAAIAQAKLLGIDTSLDDQALADILQQLNSGDVAGAASALHTNLATLSGKITDTQAAQAAAAEEAKKYGTLSLTITNGAGANVSAKLGDQETTGTANDLGVIELKLLVGTYTVTITRDGYQTLTLTDIVIASLQATGQSPTLNPNPAATPRPSSTPRPTPRPTATPGPVSSSTAHSSYRRTTVSTSRGSFTADIMEFDLGPGKIKVYTDTAADEDCTDSCPTLSVKGYADRYNGAVAAINGTYFCPADYSSCAGQVGSFFWKIMNPRLGFTINQHNGLGENDPFLTFNSSGTATFCSRWGDCRTPYAGINHKPAVVRNGSYSVDENTLDDKQRTAKISRAALGLTGQHLSVVIIQSATIMDLGSVMEALGVNDALNIDAGGSSGMWYNGAYKRGPGRSVPNALVFIEQ